MRLNPFNPQQPARPDFFVGREPEITQFEKFMFQTLSNSPMNMSVSGNRGMGKTSFLVKIEQIAKENNCLVVRLSNYECNVRNIIDFTDFLTLNIKMEILSKKPLKKDLEKVFDWITSIKPQIEWNDVKVSIEKKRVVEEIFRQRLIKLWEEIKKDFKACVVLIDEAESLERISGILTFSREVFQRISPQANYMVVLAGKLNFPERMSESFSPLNRFFPASRLEPLTFEDINEYVRKKLQETKVIIDSEALQELAKISEGHPYVLVSMCYNLFDTLKENENRITPEVLHRAMPKIRFELAKDFFSSMYHPLSPRAKEVLLKISAKISNKSFSFNEGVKFSQTESNYFSPYIQEMSRRGIINKPERAKYEFFHGLFVDYINNLNAKDYH